MELAVGLLDLQRTTNLKPALDFLTPVMGTATLSRFSRKMHMVQMPYMSCIACISCLVAAAVLSACAAPERVAPLPTRLGSRAEPAPLPPLPPLPPPPITPPSPAPEVAPVTPPIPPPPVVNAPLEQPNERLTALRQWVEQQRQLYRVAAPLLINNAPMCSVASRRILGFTAKNQYSYSSDYIEDARTGLGLEDRLQVMSVLPGSGAMQAGIQEGDILVAAGARPLSSGPNAERLAGSLMADVAAGNSTLQLMVLRGQESILVQVPLTPACAMIIDLGNSDTVASYADGSRVMVTRGMLGFVQSDDELAWVLAREIAFNVVTLAPRPDIAAVIDRLHNLNIAPQTAFDEALIAPTTPVQDAAIDRISLYMLARAGYSLDGIGEFWQHLAEAYPAEQRNSMVAMHTPIAERLPAMERTIKAIRAKQQGGLPLTP